MTWMIRRSLIALLSGPFLIVGCDDAGFEPEAEPEVDADDAGGKMDAINPVSTGATVVVTLAEELEDTSQIRVFWRRGTGAQTPILLDVPFDVPAGTDGCLRVETPMHHRNDWIFSEICGLEAIEQQHHTWELPVVRFRPSEFSFVFGATTDRFGLAGSALETPFHTGFHTVVADAPYVLVPGDYEVKLGAAGGSHLLIDPEPWSVEPLSLEFSEVRALALPVEDVRATLRILEPGDEPQLPDAWSVAGCPVGNSFTVSYRGWDQTWGLGTDPSEIPFFPSSDTLFRLRISGVSTPFDLGPGENLDVRTHRLDVGDIQTGAGLVRGQYRILRDDGESARCVPHGPNRFEHEVFPTGTGLNLPAGAYTIVIRWGEGSAAQEQTHHIVFTDD